MGIWSLGALADEHTETPHHSFRQNHKLLKQQKSAHFLFVNTNPLPTLSEPRGHRRMLLGEHFQPTVTDRSAISLISQVCTLSSPEHIQRTSEDFGTCTVV